MGSSTDVGFADLNLEAALVAAVADVGWARPSALQAAAIPAIRRGANVVLHGSRGSGITAAWGLSLLDRVGGIDVQDPPDSTELRAPLALIVTATADRAVAVASCLSRLADERVRVRALASGWQAQGARVMAGSANSIANAIERAAIKLDAIRIIVVDGYSALSEIADESLLNTIFVSIPSEAQRIVTAAAHNPRLERFVEAHARKALTFSGPSPHAPATDDIREVHCLEATEREKVGALARLVARREDSPRVAARTPGRAASLNAVLTRRGLAARCSAYGEGPVEIGFDPPMSAADAEFLQAGATVFLVPGEAGHLRRLADAVGLRVEITTEREPGGALARYRQELGRTVRTADLDAQLLVLEPLFEEFTATELAAALSALLRDKRAAELPSPDTSAKRSESPAGAPKPPSFVRLYVGAGQRDNLRPADIVGAFTAEASIGGDQIGRIDVRDSFSVVEVDAEVAERVIRSLNGTTMRGRALRVDYDRRPGTPARGARPPKRRPHSSA